MSNNNTNTLIIVAGPTGVGKTAMAIQLARYYDTEIISADSRQIYKEMSIGTAKPTKEELSVVKHHFINHKSVTEEFSSGDFETEALQLLNTLFKNKEKVIVAGGTGLYIKAITHGLDYMPPVDEGLRTKLNRQYEQQGLGPLLDVLKEKDPEYYAEMDKKNPRRVVRALEVCLTSGMPYSSFRNSSSKAKRNFGSIFIGLHMDRSVLYQQTDTRVDQMFAAGLQEEVKGLYKYKEFPSLQTVGYSELFAHFDGKYDLNEAVRLIKRNTRRYVKRQMTWLNNQAEATWFRPQEFEKVVTFINNGGI